MIDLSELYIQNSLYVVPLLNCHTLESFEFPRVSTLDWTVFTGLMDNVSLKELSFHHTCLNDDGLSEFLNVNNGVKKLKLHCCSFSYSSFFSSLESNTSLLELIIHKSNQTLNDEDVQSLIAMLQENTNLLVLNLTGSLFNSVKFKKILDALELNSALKKVSFPALDFVSYLLAVEALITGTLAINLDCTPHSIVINQEPFACSLSFSPEWSTLLTLEEISFLQRFLESFSITELNFKSFCLSSESITFLIDLMRASQFSLTSADYRKIEFSNSMTFICTFKFNSLSKLTIVNFYMDSFSNECVSTLTTLLEETSAVSKESK
ncbi:hypothetical protein GEMRC1_010748 [Eukaryota sp. GEM-RC1]